MIKNMLLALLLLASPFGAYSEETQEFYVDADNAKLFCRTIGKGKPLIVIHGGPGLSQDYLLPQLYDLAKHHFVIFYDQRGAGQSTGEIKEETMTIATMIKDLEALRIAFHLDKISLLGHSWGGLLAMHYSIEHPERVEKLILSNSSPASSNEFALFAKEYARRTSEIQADITKIQSTQEWQNGDPEQHARIFRLIFRTYCHSPKDADLLNLRMTSAAFLNGSKILQIFRTERTKPFDLHEALQKLRVPTLIIHGDDDPVPLQAAQHLHESIPGSKFVVLKDCGHFPYVEQPEEYFKSVHEFLGAKSHSLIDLP
jgi:proline iminopeptidase